MLYGVLLILHPGTSLMCDRLCIQIPHVGGRLIETGDEEFLKLPFDDSASSAVCQLLFVIFILSSTLVPVVIVFTQYDRLYDQFSYDLAKSGELNTEDTGQRKRRIEEESDKYFHEKCVQQLDKLDHPPKRMKWVWVSSMTFNFFPLSCSFLPCRSATLSPHSQKSDRYHGRARSKPCPGVSVGCDGGRSEGQC